MYSINNYKKKKKYIGNFKNICLKNIVKESVYNKKSINIKIEHYRKKFF